MYQNAQRDKEPAMSVQNLAAAWNLDSRTIRRHIKAGKIKAHRIGGRWRVFPQDLREFMIANANRA